MLMLNALALLDWERETRNDVRLQWSTVCFKTSLFNQKFTLLGPHL